MSDQVEIKEENYVHKNRISNEKLELEKEKQRIKDRKHDAFTYKYHLIDLLRLSEFTFAEEVAQKWENYKYTFNRRSIPFTEWIVHCHYFNLRCLMCNHPNQKRNPVYSHIITY